MLAARTLSSRREMKITTRIGGIGRNQAQQADPFPLPERQVQNDDIVGMLADAAARLL